MNMINLDPHRVNVKIVLLRYCPKQRFHPVFQLLRPNMLPIFRNPNKMILQAGYFTLFFVKY
jgi:hypothetical protein